MTGPGFALLVVTVIACINAITDVVKFKIYNVVTLPTLFMGLVASALFGGWAGLGQSLLGALVGFGVLLVFFTLGGVGAGDVKLLTALGAWLGPLFTFEVFLAAAVLAGIYALVLILVRWGMTIAITDLALLWHRMLTPSQWTAPSACIEDEVKRSDRRTRIVPFGAMTCLAFLLVVYAVKPVQELRLPSEARSSSVPMITASVSGGDR